MKVERDVLDVFYFYMKLTSYTETNSQQDMGIAFNTLVDNLTGKHHPKLELLIRISRGFFPEAGDELFPEIPKEVAKYLSCNEMYARIFCALLECNGARMKVVAELMCKAADKKLPSLSELLKLKEEKEKKNKKHDK